MKKWFKAFAMFMAAAVLSGLLTACGGTIKLCKISAGYEHSLAIDVNGKL